MEKVTVIYIIAISLQLAGAVILIINYCRNTHNQIIDAGNWKGLCESHINRCV